MKYTTKMKIKTQLLKLLEDLDKDEQFNPKEKQSYKDLGIKFINNLTCKEDIYKLDYNEIYKRDVNAIIVTFGFFKIVILSSELLFKFDYNDNFIVGLDHCLAYRGWGGNNIELIDNRSYASSGGPFKDRLRISKCIYINTNKYSIDLEAQVVHLLKEYHHRRHYINDFNGKGVTYGNKECNCFVCKKETERI